MISKNFARCVAKISGDGYLYYRYIRYANTCKELLDEFEQDIKYEFGDIHFTKGIGNSGTPFVQIHEKAVISKFLCHLKSYKSCDIFVPLSVKQAGQEVLANYLRALYDDEGCAGLRLFNKTKEWKRNLNLASNSLKLLKEIQEILLVKFHIKTNKIFRSRPEGHRDKTYILSITGRDNFIRFKEKIGFKHPNKIRKLNLIIESYRRTYSRNNKGFEEIKKKLGSCTHNKKVGQLS